MQPNVNHTLTKNIYWTHYGLNNAYKYATNQLILELSGRSTIACEW